MVHQPTPPNIRSSRLNRDWTQGSILRNVLSLSWPMVLTEGFAVVVMTLDAVWVGKLGPTALAGLGVGTTVIVLVMSAKVGLMTGLRAMVARFVGAQDEAGAVHAARQALVIALAFGLTTGAVVGALAEELIAVFGVDAGVVAAGGGYLRVMAAGMPGFSLRVMADSTMQSSGDTVTPMRITLLTRSVHLLVAPLVILGWWGFPAGGVAGAGIANSGAHTAAAAIGMWALFAGRSRLRLRLSGFRLDLPMMWRIVRIGLPALVMTIQRSIGYVVLTWLMAPFGTVALAAHSLVQRIDTFLFLPNWALSAGAGVLVGQNLGALQPRRSEKSVRMAGGLVGAIIAAGCMVLLLWAEGVVTLFNSDAELVETGALFLRIATAGYVGMAVVIVLSQALAGAGDTLPAMAISVAMVWAAQLPLALALPGIGGLGVLGVRWAVVGGNTLGAAAFLLYFRSGRWERRRI